MHWTEILVIIVAVYGALLSTYIFIIHRKESKPKIRIEISEGVIKHPSISVETRKICFFIKVFNKGKIPVTINSVGFKGKKDMVITVFPHMLSPLPKKIESYDGYTIYCYKEDVLKSEHTLVPLIAWVTDTTGRKYYSSKYNISVK